MLFIYDMICVGNCVEVMVVDFVFVFSGMIVWVDVVVVELIKCYVDCDKVLYWFWGEVCKFWCYIFEVVLGLFVVNFLVVVVVLFSL